ncbi:ACP S-malonyltransferase [Homoserinibacter sp. GY 40078]|uniref:ACP S-malonyltransferase n=1 Tax=Homoserinibacter sp. GY 40078 TaxID=2603275 RepID=UPI0011CA6F7D|nr:ACP S-malonyltransferase [Homoserinibacter sp. GY 40078]TXK17439.1 ACP S-malonyltransferase [Homoserinibacter sp. GY 40078]
MTVVIVAPGQGSQTPGFLEPWLAEPQFSDHLEALAEAAGVDLRTHGTTSDADTIRDTAVAQPLIVGASLLSIAGVLDGGRRDRIAGIAGHSVGELAAAAGAGIIDESDAMRLVAIRGRAMADAAAQVATGMSAVIGADADALTERLNALGLAAANVNGGGQIVVAGELDALERLREEPPAGARVIPLQVAGAFHTRFMESAVEALRAAASEVTVSDPRLRIWTNRDGSTVASGREFLDLVVGQVASPVRWDLTMENFAASGITGLVELAPAGALVGLAKRGLKGIPTVAVKTPDDLSAAQALIDQESAA